MFTNPWSVPKRDLRGVVVRVGPVRERGAKKERVGKGGGHAPRRGRRRGERVEKRKEKKEGKGEETARRRR